MFVFQIPTLVVSIGFSGAVEYIPFVPTHFIHICALIYANPVNFFKFQHWVARFTYGKELWVNRPLLNRSKEHRRLLHILCFISISQWGEVYARTTNLESMPPIYLTFFRAKQKR